MFWSKEGNESLKKTKTRRCFTDNSLKKLKKVIAKTTVVCAEQSLFIIAGLIIRSHTDVVVWGQRRQIEESFSFANRTVIQIGWYPPTWGGYEKPWPLDAVWPVRVQMYQISYLRLVFLFYWSVSIMEKLRFFFLSRGKPRYSCLCVSFVWVSYFYREHLTSCHFYSPNTRGFSITPSSSLWHQLCVL